MNFFIFLLCQKLIGIDPVKILWEGTSEEFIENELIIKPEHFLTEIGTTIKKIITSGLAGFSATVATEYFIGLITASQKSLDEDPNYAQYRKKHATAEHDGLINSYSLLCAVATGIITTIATHTICTLYLKKSVEYKAFEEFIKEWPENKPFTPKRFYKSYEALYELYHKDLKKFQTIAPEVLQKTKVLIYKFFPNQYSKAISQETQYLESKKEQGVEISLNPFIKWITQFFLKKK